MKTLELIVERRYKGPQYTIGKLSINGEYFCDTIEDIDRGLTKDMPLSYITTKKVYGETAIPRGRYRVLMNTPSPKYQQRAITDPYYRPYCNTMPRLEAVPGFSGVLIHPGTDQNSTFGCLIVGLNKTKGKLTQSRETFSRLHEILKQAHEAEQEIYITYM